MVNTAYARVRHAPFKRGSGRCSVVYRVYGVFCFLCGNTVHQGKLVAV